MATTSRSRYIEVAPTKFKTLEFQKNYVIIKVLKHLNKKVKKYQKIQIKVVKYQYLI